MDFAPAADGYSLQEPMRTYTCHDIGAVDVSLQTLSVDQLKPGLYQHRRSFPKEALYELAHSLRKAGRNAIPLIVRPSLDSTGFVIIAGERRWRAAQIAGLHDLICMVGRYSDTQSRFIAAAENLQRESLNPIDEASAYAEMSGTGLSHVEIASEVGKSRAHVSNYLRLLSLAFAVREFIAAGKLTASQARPLCALASANSQVEIARNAVKNEWTVKRIATEVAKLKNKAPAPRTSIPSNDVDVKRLTELISTTTGYPCIIQQTDEGRWRVGFSMSSSDELEGLLNRLGIIVDD
ncbi:ParB/RepB/Spo0J family partition protein (plasmid) [Halopseudomonas sp. SMJS2]|uniref:ParB/RepB/Spo0J family partition protein n=1 Tax=Halopseudomonas sp. SMJS2 TaxID=3041098 RepID=UPI002452C34C|nr:ParB/RepB/Spo0J family partition protein [Halopseudomonas sp. SMJS2]WGK63383.1 ParB/RepB/Spo0J family partition protein [Halopseudomonas sp. SMJS2]